MFELERVKGIQADIQSSDTRSLYNVDFFRKLLRVSRQADVFEPECAEPHQELIKFWRDERFTAGDSYLVDARRIFQITHQLEEFERG